MLSAIKVDIIPTVVFECTHTSLVAAVFFYNTSDVSVEVAVSLIDHTMWASVINPKETEFCLTQNTKLIMEPGDRITSVGSGEGVTCFVNSVPLGEGL